MDILKRYNMHKIVILGAGPAGYTAAIYACRAGLEAVIYEGLQPGGQLTTTTEIENFPGFPQGVDGNKLVEDMRAQALRFGAQILPGTVVSSDFSGDIKKLTLDGGEVVEAQAVIIATGASAKYLGLESEAKFRGMGVSACATCDGFFYRRRTVAVVGGGDTACEEAMYLSGLCRKVYMIVRRDVLRASEAMQAKVKAAENIEILWKTQTMEILGDEAGVTGVKLNRDGEIVEIPLEGFFLAIGHHPNSDPFDVETDEQGYIKTIGNSSKTSAKGVFAAGDVADPVYRQAIVAAGSGAKAALDAEKYLKYEIS